MYSHHPVPSALPEERGEWSPAGQALGAGRRLWHQASGWVQGNVLTQGGGLGSVGLGGAQSQGLWGPQASPLPNGSTMALPAVILSTPTFFDSIREDPVTDRGSLVLVPGDTKAQSPQLTGAHSRHTSPSPMSSPWVHSPKQAWDQGRGRVWKPLLQQLGNMSSCIPRLSSTGS